MTISLHGRQLIAGQWVSGGSEMLHPVNPATGTVLEPGFAEATADEVDAAMQAAQRVFPTIP